MQVFIMSVGYLVIVLWKIRGKFRLRTMFKIEVY
jgi:hypothetical protein